MDFVQKSNFLSWLFFTKIMSEKIVLGYFKYKTIISKLKIWSFNKDQKIDIFYRGFSMDFVQKSNFFLFAFFTEILSENNVFDIVERKEWF